MTEGELENLRGQLRVQNGTDDFGVPNGLMGVHDEEFFQILGRIIALSALVEMRLLTLYEVLTPLTQRRMRVRATRDFVDHCREQLNRFPEAEARFVQAFLDSASSVLATRHGYAHSLWPAQGGEEQFAWRPDIRNLTATIEFTKTASEMRNDLSAVIRLLDIVRWNEVIRVAQGYELEPEELAQ